MAAAFAIRNGRHINVLTNCVTLQGFWRLHGNPNRTLPHSMAMRFCSRTIGNNLRIGLLLTCIIPILVLVLCHKIDTQTNYLPGASRSIPKRSSLSKKNQSRASRVQFVSMSPDSYDTRRLGDQLFNWAAVLYVARLTGI